MSLSNTATPIYYGKFRDAVLRGDIPVCKEISMEMNRIDDLIANPSIYYDDMAVEGFVDYCEKELTLTDGSPLNLLDTFKLWAEEIFGWYYFWSEVSMSHLMMSRASNRTQDEYRQVLDAMYADVVEAEPWCASFLRSSKYDDLKRLESAILDSYEGTDMCTQLLKLIDKVRNNG